MFSIFCAFTTLKTTAVKPIAVSFAVGVAIDAFVVRLALVPAIMAVVRSKLWYHPRWFARYVPDPDIEGDQLEKQLAAERVPTRTSLTFPDSGTTVRSESRSSDSERTAVTGDHGGLSC
jgi:hypothetical protein